MAEQRFLDEHGLELFWDEKVKKYTDHEVDALDAELASVAKSGDYDDLDDKPIVKEKRVKILPDDPTGYELETMEDEKSLEDYGLYPLTNEEIEYLMMITDSQ